MAWLTSLGYMGVVLILLLIPDNGNSGELLRWFSSDIQNLFHIPAFGFLALLWVRTFKTQGRSAGWSVLGSFVVVAGYGILSELLQTGVPGRTASIMDLGLDLTGVVLGLFFYSLYKG